MNPLEEVFQYTKSYLEGSISLGELHRFLGEQMEIFLHYPDSPGTRVALEIEGCLAEIELGHRTEDSLKDEVRHLLESTAMLNTTPNLVRVIYRTNTDFHTLLEKSISFERTSASTEAALVLSQ